MKKLKKPVARSSNGVYELKSATINGYEYTKTYYKMENGVPVRCENGDDGCLTIVNIRKVGDESEHKRAFIFSEGYIGAERSYNEDGTKSKSISKKDGFGVAYLIKYIENSKENGIDNFHVMFLSDKETSENQAELYAQAIKDISEGVEKTFIWNHSKAGLLALRTFEKLKEAGDLETLSKIKAVLTSIPTKGIDTVNREKMINKLENNKFVNILPFSGFIKNGLLAWYDTFLYKPTPAQVDMKKDNTELQLRPTKGSKFFNKLWGNDTFHKRVENAKKVPYDEGYLSRTTSSESLEKIEDVDYKVLPVNLEFKDALNGLVKHGQLMPFILLAKKALSREKGDGIVTYSEQGMEDINAKYKTDTVVRSGHDMPTTPDALETIKEELLDDEER